MNKTEWNSMTPLERLEFIKKTGSVIGVSNSKCTYDNLSSSARQFISTEAIGVKSEEVPEKEESLDLLCIFDDTGSMSSVRKLVRQKIDELTSKMFKDIKNLRIAVFIQNDYCDAPRELIIQDFTDDARTVQRFVHSDSPCGGGDYKECYELSLQKARFLNWKSDNKVLVIIADAEPHEVGYRYGGKTYDLDWRKETSALNEMGVQIYSVQALGNRSASYFYEQMAHMTNGIKLDLAQFAHVETYIKAIAYHQVGTLEDFENSDPSFKTNLSLKNMFSKLKGFSGDKSIEDKMEFLSKFQVMNVEKEIAIKDFVEMNGCTFQRGHGYYSLIPRTMDGKANSEIIQSDKKVLFIDKLTGEVSENTYFNRKLLGIPYGTKGTCRPLQIPDVMNKYEIFIQSNSYNRKLDRGCKFLYLMDRC